MVGRAFGAGRVWGGSAARAVVVAVGLATGLGAAGGCASSDDGIREGDGVKIYDLGEPFRTRQGTVHVIRVQDEYRLVRCIPDGPIAGCYEDILSVPRAPLSDDSVPGPRWNQWIDVPTVEGLKIAFVGTGRVAVREEPVAPAPQ